MSEKRRPVKEKSVTCLECGKSFKVLSKKHLGTHDLTAEEYRKKMKDMRLWEKRKKA